jgi:predicted Zn-dependent protease
MLFDLRSRGRRRTVQAVYLGLAILMGGGLVLFGVGAGNGFGGILDAFTGNGSGSAQKSVVSQQEKTALRETRQQPNNPQSWSDLVQARWTNAGQGGNYNASTGQFTASGKKELTGATQAWQRYLTLVKTPDADLTILAARAYTALGQYGQAASTWEQETVASPSAPKGYECLAANAYAASQARKGDLATGKALALLPKAQQSAIKQQLQQAKSSPSSAKALAIQGC